MDVSAPFQSLLNARFLEIFHYFGNKIEQKITPKMADRNFSPTCTAFLIEYL